MVIRNRNLAVGTRLVAKYKGVTYPAIVLPDRAIGVPNDHATPSFSQADMMIYKSVSAAGSAIMGGIACNGWRFWSVAGEAPAAEKADKAPKAAKATSKRTRAKKAASKAPPAAEGDYMIDGDGRPVTCAFCGAQMRASDNPDECGHAEGQGGAAGVLDEPYGGETPLGVEMEAEVPA